MKILSKRTIEVCVFIVVLLMAAGTAVAQSGGEVLYNGIVMPQQWPPLAVPSQNYQLPTYITNPPAIIPIDVGRQLFVDDFMIQQTTMTRTAHQPVKYSLNPIVTPSAADTSHLAMPSSSGVWFDPADNTFKMWFFCGDGTTMCYAYSADGKNWIRPSFPNAIVPNTDQVLEAPSNTVWMDLNATNPAQKFKMFSYQFGSTYGIVTYFSADGITWVPQFQANYPIGAIGDRTTLFWNPFRNVWVDSEKSYVPLPATGNRSGYDSRARYYAESPDLFTWHPSNFTDTYWTGPDVNDPPYPGAQTYPQLYSLDGVAYESVTVGLFSWFYPGPNDGDDAGNLPGPDLVELGVGFSRDGFQWFRPTRGGGPANAFIPASNIAGTWDRGNTQSAGGNFLVVGDELWFYFSGRSGLHADPAAVGATGLATLRRDGFYSMDAGATPATLLTRPLKFSGKYMFVNVSDPQGSLQIQLIDAGTQAVLATSNPLTVNKTLQAVTWMSGLSDLSQFAGRNVQFQFTLTNGELYAFWVSASTNGASNGYVAAMGPGFSGQTDTLGSQSYPTVVATPQMFPPGGNFQQTLSVNITTGTLGATIHYTTDGTTPTASSPTYTGPIQLTSTTTLQAIAVAAGMTPSSIISVVFTSDTTAPTVSITNPLNQHIVSGTVNLTASTSDNSGIASVTFLADGSPIGTATSAPFTLPFATTALTNTTHQLTAIATDGVGNVGTSSPITITVNNVTSGPTAGLIGYWSFDLSYVSGSTLYDQSGANANATATSTASIAGRIGQGMQFNGSSSNAMVIPGSSYDLLGNLSLALWVRTTNTSRYEGLLSKFAAADSGYGYLLRTDPSGHAELMVGGENTVSGITSLSIDPSYINDGNWHHVAVTISLTSGIAFYIDGVRTSSFPLLAQPVSAASFFVMGQNPWLDYGTYFTGSMDEVRVYNRVLSAADVAALAQPYAPSVSITAPGPNQTVSQTIVVSATASDNAGIASVLFQVDGASVATSTAAPFAINLDTTTLANHTVHQLSAIATDLEGNQGASQPISVTVVNLAKPVITWSAPAPIVYGTPLSGTQLNATASVQSSFSYNPASGTVLQAGTQTLNVVVTPNDTTNYMSGTASVSLVVNQAVPVITWTDPSPIPFGTALSGTQLNASASVPGTYSYTPALGAVLGTGAQTLSVTFTPSDSQDYTTATATVTLAVNRAIPAITWTTPPAITYGTALSSTQLNASASVAGTFSYSPALGTVLNAGAQTLSVTFNPSDTQDYTSTTAMLTQVVNQATPVITWANPSSIVYGTALSSMQLNASASVPGTFAYVPASGTVLNTGAQPLSVTFSPSDTQDYKSATATVTLMVSQPIASANQATFGGLDTTTQGNWQSKYGAGGWALALYGQNIPSYATLTPQSTLQWTWATGISDARALLTPGGGLGMVSAWYNNPTFSFDVNFTDGNAHQIAVYALDWDSTSRAETIQILDGSNSTNVLDSESISNFSNGVYLAWTVKGHVVISVTRTGGANAVINGVFFGAPSQTAPAITSANNATFSIGTAGSFTVTATGSLTPSITESGALPSGVTFNTSTGVLSGTPASGTANSYPITFTASNGVSPNAQQSFTLTVAATAPTITSANSTTFTVGSAGTFTVKANGSPTITFSETGTLPTGVSLNSTTGVLSGTPAAGTANIYPITITANNGVSPNGTQSFTLTVNATAAGPQVSFVGSDTTTQGNWQSKYGSDGYSLANYGQSVPSYANLAPQNTLQWTWAASATDPRALRLPNSTQALVAGWYNKPSFSFDVNLTDGNVHQIALYALDWDSTTRAEMVQITDTNGNQLDSESISSYFNGVYLVWNVSGHVIINVTCTGGANAVINGVFFGAPPQTAPAITSVNSTTFSIGTAGSFTVTATGSPTPSITESGALPSGVTFNTSTGVLSGTPASGTAPSYPITITASNGVSPNAQQSFTLNVAATAPTITSANSTTFTVGSAGSFTVKATGSPTITFSETGALPTGVTFSTTTGVLSGTPAAGTANTYPIIIAANNGVSPNGSQNFTLTVNAQSTGGSSVSFLGQDAATQGNWQSKYGSDGYSLAGYGQSLPTYATLTPQNTLSYTWSNGISDARAMTLPGSSLGIVAAWYNNPSFSFDVSFTDGNTHQIALYVLDWDSASRAESIQIVDANNSSNILDTESIANFSNGVYLVWTVKGHVTINVLRTGGANGVVNGILFGSGGTATFLGTDTTTQGNWTGKYGTDGYAIANGAQNIPSYSGFGVQNAFSYTWAAGTTDVRALKAPGGGTGSASTWYNNPSFYFNVTVSGGAHQIALYLLDWDTLNTRAETIQVTDANSGAVLDTETVSNFSNGIYLLWNITGSVRLTFTRTGGPNGVAGALFFK